VLLIIAILLAIAIPTFLGVTGSANDRAAQSNLTNGLTELKALYQNGQTYCPTAGTCASGLTPLLLTGVGSVQSSAPEFSWSNGSTGVTAGNNISMQPVDVSTAQQGDGVIIATLSKNNNTCWFATDLESTPTTAFAGGDASGSGQFIAAAALTTVGAQWNSTGGAAPAAGVYYSKVNNIANGGCKANAPLQSGSTNAWVWGTSFANAPADVVGTN